MSLKHFHIVFIVIAGLFCVLFALWCFRAEGADPSIRIMGWVSLAGGVALAVHCPWFFKKSRKVIL